MIDNVFYNLQGDNRLSRVIIDNFKEENPDEKCELTEAHPNALAKTKLLDLDFKVGQPYLLRHSTRTVT